MSNGEGEESEEQDDELSEGAHVDGGDWEVGLVVWWFKVESVCLC